MHRHAMTKQRDKEPHNLSSTIQTDHTSHLNNTTPDTQTGRGGNPDNVRRSSRVRPWVGLIHISRPGRSLPASPSTTNSLGVRSGLNPQRTTQDSTRNPCWGSRVACRGSTPLLVLGSVWSCQGSRCMLVSISAWKTTRLLMLFSMPCSHAYRQ